ncbi:hypothetical protein NPIL_186951 [Nephila pilipes]|uniref:Uncharacterized protein n=1 Tax=Nephila pilipes TaxID=299642 RepID=A0A8X6PIY8_NEPPI|nr:hypothetical protein NPIL_186951 [Nephila pilipes]
METSHRYVGNGAHMIKIMTKMWHDQILSLTPTKRDKTDKEKKPHRENKCICCWKQRKTDNGGCDNSLRRRTKRAEGVAVVKMYQLENQKTSENRWELFRSYYFVKTRKGNEHELF